MTKNNKINDRKKRREYYGVTKNYSYYVYLPSKVFKKKEKKESITHNYVQIKTVI